MRRSTELEEQIIKKFAHINPVLDERSRRLWGATESQAMGYGGDAIVSAATGMSRTTLRRGRHELLQKVKPTKKLRQAGGGRPKLEKLQPGLKEALEKLIDPLTRGDPESPLRWTCKSRAKLCAEMVKNGWNISSTKVSHLLHELHYSLQSARKSKEGSSHPDRNAQFENIAATASRFLRLNQPVISVDTKKKELVGNFKNGGREWQPRSTPEEVRVHDFPSEAIGKAIPYGVYDMGRNEACVNVGKDHDTPAFAVASIRQWWNSMGKPIYAKANELFITADSGGSNSARARAWKFELQKFSDETKLVVHVSHFPPGTSKWNKIEHRAFCHITENWRGKPLRTFETVVQLIGNTKTQAGLRVEAKLDSRKYATGIKITDAQMKEIDIRKNSFHGEWNYSIHPRQPANNMDC